MQLRAGTPFFGKKLLLLPEWRYDDRRTDNEDFVDLHHLFTGIALHFSADERAIG